MLASIRLKARKALLGRDEFGARGTPGPAAASDRGAGNYVEYVEGLVGQTHVNSIFLYVILVHVNSLTCSREFTYRQTSKIACNRECTCNAQLEKTTVVHM